MRTTSRILQCFLEKPETQLYPVGAANVLQSRVVLLPKEQSGQLTRNK